MSAVNENLARVRAAIARACFHSRREITSVELIAVSKTFCSDAIRDAVDCGQFHFGESKLQEAEPKIEMLPSFLHWHFIGRVQRNKVRKLLPLFGVIHSVDSIKLATYINEVARELGLFPDVFLQVNIGGELSKGGLEVLDIEEAMEAILKLDRLGIVGLMCIPPPASDVGLTRGWFNALREMRDDLELKFGVKLPSLSMGMSHDFEIAIEEGATHVRVGSAIFGKRSYQVDGELGSHDIGS
ncbi:MAG: YggS family pyridoxal phosphate-dependent enzyme [Luteolibacter sp.]